MRVHKEATTEHQAAFPSNDKVNRCKLSPFSSAVVISGINNCSYTLVCLDQLLLEERDELTLVNKEKVKFNLTLRCCGEMLICLSKHNSLKRVGS